MPNLQLIQVSIEIMLIIICILIWILTRFWAREYKREFRKIWYINLLSIGLLISDIVAIIYRGNLTITGYYLVRIANYFNFFFIYLITLCAIFLAQDIFANRHDVGTARFNISKILTAIALFNISLNVFVPFTYSFDEQNRYYRMLGWYVNAALIFISIILTCSVIIQLRNEGELNVIIILLIYILMPLVASVVQVFIYGISITDISIGISQTILFVILFRYQEEKLRERDYQLSEYNAKLMLTQVQPHFMLNALSTIQYLCKTDSDAAAETISDFAIYIRNNMDFAATTELISFEKELSHIEKYVSIEQKRFGGRIKVVYDIKEKDFELPPLSVQPLIENAIKHGISKKRGGGTVELSTLRGVDKIHIIVRDDGVGYDTSKPFSEDRVHLGLKIVGDRINRRCGGELKITSSINVGTICEITIPIVFN